MMANSSNTSVDNLWKEIISIQNILNKQKEISLLSDYNNTIRKVLLLSCGSHFEKEMTEMLKRYVKNATNDYKIVNFLEKQAIYQKYHTLFDWGEKNNPDRPSKNINTFLKLFGDDFKNSVLNINDNDFENAKNAFLEIGHIRNILVHNDFAAYSYEQKTPEDIYKLYEQAKEFIPKIENLLMKNAKTPTNK